MNMIWIALAVVAVLIALVAISAGVRRTRSLRLREHFGTEYDRAVTATGNRVRGEQELVARAEEVNALAIRTLNPAERDRFQNDWHRVEMQFVERPATAVVEADELISAVMRARGFPIADFEAHAAHLSVKHPRVVEHYREGHAVIESQGHGQVSTEGLRQAMLHYRALFDDLVNAGFDVEQEIPMAREVAPKPIIREPAPDEYPSREEVTKR